MVEITDYDEDRTDQRDTIAFQVQVNEQEAVVLEATETTANSGIFTKEIDTAAQAASPDGKPESDTQANVVLAVKAGDRIMLRYLDTHNTFPGHTVPREEVVFVPEPHRCTGACFGDSRDSTAQRLTATTGSDGPAKEQRH